MAIFYFINWIVAAETIEGGKLFAEIRYVNNFSSQFHVTRALAFEAK